MGTRRSLTRDRHSLQKLRHGDQEGHGRTQTRPRATSGGDPILIPIPPTPPFSVLSPVDDLTKPDEPGAERNEGNRLLLQETTSEPFFASSILTFHLHRVRLLVCLFAFAARRRNSGGVASFRRHCNSNHPSTKRLAAQPPCTVPSPPLRQLAEGPRPPNPRLRLSGNPPAHFVQADQGITRQRSLHVVHFALGDLRRSTRI